MSKPLAWSALLFASTLSVAPLYAQTGPEPPAPADDAAGAPAAPDGGVEVAGLGEIVVLGRSEENLQQSTTQVITVLSNEDIARTGEGDIAGALGRVTGLSVVGGGFVYVRGLGDRYSQALLNGSPLPSPEPLRRAVPLDLFPTDVIASSLVQKTYSPNYPGEFGGGVINLTTLAVPQMPFLNLSLGASGDTETTNRLGYDHFGSDTDWTGYDDGERDVPPALRDFLASRQRVSAGSVDAGRIASQLVNVNTGLLQKVDHMPANFSGTLSGGSSWMVGESRLGLIATGGLSNGWRTRDNIEQSPGDTDLSSIDKDYRSVSSENRVIANGLLGVGLEFGEGNRLRWTNLYIHDTLKRSELAEGRQYIQRPGWEFREQSTGWYERELLSTQLAATLQLEPLTIDARASYSKSQREAPFELDFGYSRSNVAANPYGAYFINRLDNGQTGYARAAFSELDEDLKSAGVDVTWRLAPAVALSGGIDYANTERDSQRREFQIIAPSTFPSGVAMLRPDYLLGAEVIDFYDIGLVETTETDPAFAARLRTEAGYLQLQAEVLPGLEIAAGARYERAKQQVRPLQVFEQLTNSGASTQLDNDYVLPAATLTWKLRDAMQVRLNASKTIARPQFRELMFQTFYDPEGNRSYRGNPLLVDSEFFNGEARFEWYFAPEQRFSLAAFYKDIDRPIEGYTTFSESSPVTSFANAPKAKLYGVETEVQYHLPLDLLWGTDLLAARRLVAIGNYTWTSSDISVGAADTVQVYGSTVTTRPASDFFVDGGQLSGQSNHLVNLQLGVEQTGRLSQQTVLLSYASKRVTSRGGGSMPDLYEFPGLRVDLVAREGFELAGRGLELKFEVRNIFGRDYREQQERGGNRVFYNRYDIGTSFALSLTASF